MNELRHWIQKLCFKVIKLLTNAHIPSSLITMSVHVIDVEDVVIVEYNKLIWGITCCDWAHIWGESREGIARITVLSLITIRLLDLQNSLLFFYIFPPLFVLVRNSLYLFILVIYIPTFIYTCFLYTIPLFILAFYIPTFVLIYLFSKKQEKKLYLFTIFQPMFIYICFLYSNPSYTCFLYSHHFHTYFLHQFLFYVNCMPLQLCNNISGADSKHLV